MEGVIIVSKKRFLNFENVCEDRFNGTYKIEEEFVLAYKVRIFFKDIQDVFSLGQIYNQEILENNSAT